MEVCGFQEMQLSCIAHDLRISELRKRVQDTMEAYGIDYHCQTPEKCLCFNCDDVGEKPLKKSASRENGEDNFLYNPIVKEKELKDLDHFQRRNLWNSIPILWLLQSSCVLNPPQTLTHQRRNLQ